MLVAALGALGASGFAEITVDDKLPAGNIVVDGVKDDVVRVRQDQRDTVGEKWFYWAMRVTGAAGRTVKFAFDKNPGGGPVGVRGPVVSLDRGRTFSYPLDGKSKADGFTYAFPKDADEVWFYECHPYVRADWDRFTAKHGLATCTGNPAFEVGTLCKSRKGADVPLARVGCIQKTPKYRIFMSARHHCSESMASWVL